jgi:hypothetical protein
MDGWRQGSVRTPVKLRAQATNKTAQKWICGNPLWEQIMSRELNTSIQTMSGSSVTINTWQCLNSQRGTSSILLWTRFDRQEQWHAENRYENILFQDEKISKIEQYNCHNKIYAQTSCEVKENVLRVQGRHHPSYIMIRWGVQSWGDIHFYKGWNWCQSVSRKLATRSRETS